MKDWKCIEYCVKCLNDRRGKECACGSKRFTNNAHGVARKIWTEWSGQAREVFALVYNQGRDQSIFIHPKTQKESDEQWDTTAFNFAYAAAEAVDGYVQYVGRKGKGRL